MPKIRWLLLKGTKQKIHTFSCYLRCSMCALLERLMYLSGILSWTRNPRVVAQCSLLGRSYYNTQFCTRWASDSNCSTARQRFERFECFECRSSVHIIRGSHDLRRTSGRWRRYLSLGTPTVGIGTKFEETSMRIDDCTKSLWNLHSCTNLPVSRDIEVHLSDPSGLLETC